MKKILSRGWSSIRAIQRPSTAQVEIRHNIMRHLVLLTDVSWLCLGNNVGIGSMVTGVVGDELINFHDTSFRNIKLF